MDRERIEVTQAELLAALEAAITGNSDEPTDAMTTREIASLMEWDYESAKCKVRSLVNAGLMEVVKVRRECMDGATRRLPAYRLVRGSEAA